MLFEDAKQAWGMYEGSKHKPADFDRFWDQALQDLDALPLDYTLSKCDIASHTADCYDLYFTG
ncbi:MAG: acetylxylan esterase, partial [Treponema sp.]|nr:acetylxylan esterase [Treponema sp.]